MAGAKGATKWRPQPLFMGSYDELIATDVMDILKLTGQHGDKEGPVPKLGTSDEAKYLKEALLGDSYNMHLINELGFVYAQDHQLDKCSNVLVRGWKRVSEIEDKQIRFRYLMKLCEFSLELGKFHQAHAVFTDIEEPEEKSDLWAYLVFAVKVHANRPSGGDLLQTLKVFQRCLEGADSKFAIRIWALTHMDLKKVGGYEAAKAVVDKCVGPSIDRADIWMIDELVTKTEQFDKKGATSAKLEKGVVTAVAVAIASVLIYLLYVIEQRSVAKIFDA